MKHYLQLDETQKSLLWSALMLVCPFGYVGYKVMAVLFLAL